MTPQDLFLLLFYFVPQNFFFLVFYICFRNLAVFERQASDRGMGILWGKEVIKPSNKFIVTN